jgi:hypothetical protein
MSPQGLVMLVVCVCPVAPPLLFVHRGFAVCFVLLPGCTLATTAAARSMTLLIHGGCMSMTRVNDTLLNPAGYRAAGNSDQLRSLCGERGLPVAVVELVGPSEDGGVGVVSSSKVCHVPCCH